MKHKVFEITLHNWEPWLASIVEGRVILKNQESPPSLEKMKSQAAKALENLDFPKCTLFELHWLCCVFSDYDSGQYYDFKKLVLPEWFPKKYGFTLDGSLDFKGKRIFPPDPLSESEVEFWRQRNPLHQILPKKKRIGICLDTDFNLVLPMSHPIQGLVSHGRPKKLIPTKKKPEPVLQQSIAEYDQESVSKPKPPTKCYHCGCRGLLWEHEDKIYKCMLCSRPQLQHHYSKK